MSSYRNFMVSALCTLAVVALLAAPASAIIIAADDMEYDAGRWSVKMAGPAMTPITAGTVPGAMAPALG